ncbi:MAG: RluA family pseudouridine synthase [Candidatus Borkfalkiaceae bacterium]|nr:RluA family pseudouridine synthase [Clostridia bacterium]MDY6224042.1 RluA family pseudouridine synthase [Christensenellaceae bacterium]
MTETDMINAAEITAEIAAENADGKPAAEQNEAYALREKIAEEKGLHILYEDNQIIVVLKPQMTACCPDESKDANLFDEIKAYLKEAYQKQGNVYLGLVHRLDRPTGGVMVYAKTSKAAGRLCEGLAKGDFEKKYLAVLVGAPESERGTLTNYLRKNTVNNMVYICTPSEEGAKYAELDYKVLDVKNSLALTEIRLHTGRTHQIRVQTAGISHPVYGDMRYGGATAKKGKLALFAYSLSFTHPVSKERMKFISLPPDETPWKAFDTEKLLALNGRNI